MQQVDSDLLSQFNDIWEDEDTCALDALWPYVNPQMSELERVRKATLVVLASPGDRNGFRGRSHLLLHGKEGTGKSLVRNWVVKRFANAYPSGPSDSEAGLKADMSGGSITPGALQLAHDGYLGIDELDEFGGGERGALLESMSDGKFAINKGESRKTFDAACRVIAACNRTDQFRAELLDRFDFVIEVDGYDESATITVTDDRYDHFYDGFVRGERVEDEYVVPQYISIIERFEPGVEPETVSQMKEMKNQLIETHELSGDIRGKETWLRVAYTIAKLNRRDMQPDDYVTAVELTNPELDPASVVNTT